MPLYRQSAFPEKVDIGGLNCLRSSSSRMSQLRERALTYGPIRWMLRTRSNG